MKQGVFLSVVAPLGGGDPAALTVVDVSTYPGATLGSKLAAAYAALPSYGGVLDCRKLTGTQTSDGLTISVAKPVEIIFGASTILVPAGPFIDIVAAGAGSKIRGSGARVSVLAPSAGVGPVLRATATSEVEFLDLAVQFAGASASNVAIHFVESGATRLVGGIVRNCQLLSAGTSGVGIRLGKVDRVSVMDCTVSGFGLLPIDVVANGVDSARQFAMTGCTFPSCALTIPHSWYQSAVFGEDKVSDVPGPNMQVTGGWYLTQYNRVTYELTEPVEALEAALFVKNASASTNLTAAFVGVSYVHTNANVNGGTAGVGGSVEYTGGVGSVLAFARGVDGNVAHKGAGQIQNAEAFRSHIDVDVGGTGNILNAYAFHAYAPLNVGPGGGTMTNYFGVFIDDPASGSLVATNRYAIYTAGGHVYLTTPSDANALLIDGASGRVFMGTVVDGGSVSKLTVAQTVTATSGGRVMLNFVQTNNPTANSVATVQALSSFATIPSANIRDTAFMGGIFCEANHAGSGTAGETVGCNALATNTGGGTSSAAQGVFAAARNTGGGTISLGAALHAGPPVNSGGGTYSAWYGLLVDDPGSVVTPTNAYAIYCAGGRVEFTNNVRFILNAKAHLAQTAAELIDVSYNLARSVQFTTGGVIATQRAFLVGEPTYTATSASQTITSAATLAVSGAPVAGTNVIITNSYALWVQTGRAAFDGGMLAGAEPAGVAGKVGYTNTVDNSANSTGVGTIKMKGVTSRDSTGYLKILDGTAAKYIPYFDAITG